MNVIANFIIKKKFKIILILWGSNFLFSLKSVSNIILDHKLIFDMDYPYYLKFNDQIVSFTCDFGIVVLKLWIFICLNTHQSLFFIKNLYNIKIKKIIIHYLKSF